MLAFAAILAIALFQAAPSSSGSVQPAAASPEIRFSFEHAQLDPATYSLVVKEDGSGHYESTPGPVSASGSPTV